MRRVTLILLFALAIPVATYAMGEGRLFAAVGNIFQSSVALVAYGFMAGVLLGYFIGRMIKSSRKKTAHHRSIPQQQDSGWPIPNLAEVSKDLEGENAGLKEELKRLGIERDEYKRHLAETEYLLNTPQVEYKGHNTRVEAEILYYLQPTTDGMFKVSGKVNNAAEALYQLRCKNSSEATIQFIDTPENAAHALQNEHSWILSACERNNIATANTYAIRTDIPGKAMLRGADWEIVQKAKITYIG